MTQQYFSLFQNFSNTKNYLPPEMKSFFTPGKVSLIEPLNSHVGFLLDGTHIKVKNSSSLPPPAQVGERFGCSKQAAVDCGEATPE